MVTMIADWIPGHKMCCICFEYIQVYDLWVDRDGQKWDMCKPCAAYEEVCKGLKSIGYTNEDIPTLLRALTENFFSATLEP